LRQSNKFVVDFFGEFKNTNSDPWKAQAEWPTWWYRLRLRREIESRWGRHRVVVKKRKLDGMGDRGFDLFIYIFDAWRPKRSLGSGVELTILLFCNKKT
jgi:hypothetical protein